MLAEAGVAEIVGDADVEVASMAYDSAHVEPGTLFFCVRGSRSDGHDFAPEAVSAGAAALVVERHLDLPVPQAVVNDVRRAMAPAAVRFFGDPTGELKVAGVTGTNGKTTTTFLIRRILEAAETQTGLLGTVKRIVGGREEQVERTTPEAIDLQSTFRRMLDAGDEACAMEVSSHALALERSAGTRFEVAVFTNLSQDHLDFHADMDDYFLAKRRLFVAGEDAAATGSEMPWRRPEAAVVNLDDAYGERLVEDLRADGQVPLYTFSPAGREDATFRAAQVSFDASGSRFVCLGPDGKASVQMPLPGDFNVENALAAIAATHILGVPSQRAAEALASAERVPGRFEAVEEGQGFTVLVDYAHTPDSLENALEAARRVTTGRLIAVFGCGGDRDRDKRPLMGEVAARLSDLCVVTSDNPRSEEPEAIIAQILEGIPSGELEAEGGVTVQPDRRKAIGLALARATGRDTVLIAGKGHEQGQEFEGGQKIPFDDREVAREELRHLRSAA